MLGNSRQSWIRDSTRQWIADPSYWIPDSSLAVFRIPRAELIPDPKSKVSGSHRQKLSFQKYPRKKIEAQISKIERLQLRCL